MGSPAAAETGPRVRVGSRVPEGWWPWGWRHGGAGLRLEPYPTGQDWRPWELGVRWELEFSGCRVSLGIGVHSGNWGSLGVEVLWELGCL